MPEFGLLFALLMTLSVSSLPQVRTESKILDGIPPAHQRVVRNGTNI